MNDQIQTTRYVVATKRARRGIVPSAVDMLRPLIGVTIVDSPSLDLALIDSERTIEDIRTAIGPDYRVEREIIYGLPEIYF